MSFTVHCNDALVEMNGFTEVPTLLDAQARVAFHAGMEASARWARKDPSVMLFPFPPFPDEEAWPWEDHEDGAVSVLVWDLYYMIRKV
jgi:hypothetical protein